MIQADLSYLPILVAAIAYMVVGAVWYSPQVFGKKWMALTKFSEGDIAAGKKTMGKSYLISFIAALITAFVLSNIIDVLGAVTIGGGIQAAFWLWIGFVATTSIGAVLWAKQPKELYILNNAHILVGLAVMGAILAVWS